MTEESAQFSFAAPAHEPATLAARSVELWAELAFDQDAHAILKRDGLDPAALRLTGPHPFAYEAAPGGTIAVTARAADEPSAEALLDLFRIYFLRRLTA